MSFNLKFKAKKRPLFLFFFMFQLAACTIYRSPDRKDFEGIAVGLQIQSLTATSCSAHSVKGHASASKLVNIMNSDTGTVFLWQHQIDHVAVFESDNANGVYCLYAMP